MKQNKIEQFLATYNSKNTIKTNRCGLNLFFKTINKKPNTYIKKNQTYKEDIIKFQNTIYNKSPRTITNYIGAVKLFLEEYDVELNNKFWKKLKRRGKGNKPLTQDIIPTHTQIKRMLSHANLMERTIILMSLSSGIRIGELLDLEKDKHIMTKDLESLPTPVYISSVIAKNNVPRTTFISKEATDSLKEWFSQRDNYIQNTWNKVNFPNVTKTPLDRNTIFPIDYETIRKRFIKLLEKIDTTDRDIETNHYKLHLHSLRKFFSTHMKTLIPVPVVEKLSGHEGYLTSNYDRYSYEQLRDYYIKGEKSILIYETQPDTSDIRKELTELKRLVIEQSLTDNKSLWQNKSNNDLYIKIGDKFLNVSKHTLEDKN